MKRTNSTLFALLLILSFGCKSDTPSSKSSWAFWDKKAKEHEPTLAERLKPLLHSYDDSGAVVSARVIELPSGKELYAEHVDRQMTPASNGKLAVSAAALDRFGIDYTFNTYLTYDGENLWLIGTGDPGTGDPRIAKKYGQKVTSMLDA